LCCKCHVMPVGRAAAALPMPSTKAKVLLPRLRWFAPRGADVLLEAALVRAERC
jgi:hypothetical protein